MVGFLIAVFLMFGVAGWSSAEEQQLLQKENQELRQEISAMKVEVHQKHKNKQVKTAFIGGVKIKNLREDNNA